MNGGKEMTRKPPILAGDKNRKLSQDPNTVGEMFLRIKALKEKQEDISNEIARLERSAEQLLEFQQRLEKYQSNRGPI